MLVTPPLGYYPRVVGLMRSNWGSFLAIPNRKEKTEKWGSLTRCESMKRDEESAGVYLNSQLWTRVSFWGKECSRCADWDPPIILIPSPIPKFQPNIIAIFQRKYSLTQFWSGIQSFDLDIAPFVEKKACQGSISIVFSANWTKMYESIELEQ